MTFEIPVIAMFYPAPPLQRERNTLKKVDQDLTLE